MIPSLVTAVFTQVSDAFLLLVPMTASCLSIYSMTGRLRIHVANAQAGSTTVWPFPPKEPPITALMTRTLE